MRILIAEGEAEFARTLQAILERQNYGTDTVTNGPDALDYALSGSYGAVLLALTLPGLDGVGVVTTLRKEGETVPVMLLAGADSLETRVRRSSVYVPDALTFGSLTLDTAAYRLSTPAGVMQLNNKEFQVMELFMRSPHSLLSAQQLMERVWGWDAKAEINVVWTNIASLRRKLAALDAGVTIRLVRGVGYILEAA